MKSRLSFLDSIIPLIELALRGPSLVYNSIWVFEASISAPSLLLPVASRCFGLLLVPEASLSAPSSLLPVASRCCCLKFFGAARGFFFPTFHSHMKS